MYTCTNRTIFFCLSLGSSSSKHTITTTDRGHSDVMIDGGDASEAGEGREGSVGVEEVLVEVEEEGTMVDEFRQEQQLEKTKRKKFRGRERESERERSWSFTYRVHVAIASRNQISFFASFLDFALLYNYVNKCS